MNVNSDNVTFLNNYIFIITPSLLSPIIRIGISSLFELLQRYWSFDGTMAINKTLEAIRLEIQIKQL